MFRVGAVLTTLLGVLLTTSHSQAFPEPNNKSASGSASAPVQSPQLTTAPTSPAAALQSPPANSSYYGYNNYSNYGDPRGRDAVLDWNDILCNVNAIDHSGIYGPPEQGGPCKTARAMAIVHIAIFDAVNSIQNRARKYLTYRPSPGASIDAAVTQAAYDTLVSLYPSQAANLRAAHYSYLSSLRPSSAKSRGIEVGRACAAAILANRSNDGSGNDPIYTEGLLPGDHRVDPLNPGQGYLNPGWGGVKPFVLLASGQFRSIPPPALNSAEYAAAFNEVKDLGGDGVNTFTFRNNDQTEIGLFWAYDGTRGLGTPPRLYNQIARQISLQERTDEVDNARLFALLNIAQAEAGLCCWESKYVYNFWRPVVGIREADSGTGPSGLGDNNTGTTGDANYYPLGAPARNGSNGGVNFTPGFPAYPSGHATFGGATFRIFRRFYKTDNIPFSFVSDELNGVTRDNNNVPRAFSPRSYNSFSQADAENAQSRIYLGIHWQFDATAGMDGGHSVADWTYDNCLQRYR